MKKIIERWKTRNIRRLKRQLVQLNLGEHTSRPWPPFKRNFKPDSEAGGDERSLQNPAEDAQSEDKYLPLRNLLHFLALEVDKLRDLIITNRLNTLLKRNISTPDGMLYTGILNDATPGRISLTQRRRYTGFETFPWTDPLDPNIVRGVMGTPGERQAVIRDMVISVLRMSNPGVRIDFGAAEYS